jgi:hypothetical protein
MFCSCLGDLQIVVNKSRLKDWLKDGRRMSGTERPAGSAGILLLASELPFRYIHEAKVEGTVTRYSGDVHLVSMMSVDGRGSNLETAKRVSVGDLRNNPVYLDIQKVCTGEGVHGSLAAGEDINLRPVSEENGGGVQFPCDEWQPMTAVFTKLQQVCRIGTEKSGEEEGIEGFEFSAKFIDADAAGGQRRAVDFAFQKQQREGRCIFRQCEFHFLQSKNQVCSSSSWIIGCSWSLFFIPANMLENLCFSYQHVQVFYVYYTEVILQEDMVGFQVDQ